MSLIKEKKFLEVYQTFIKYVFFVFLFLLIAFGRGFAVFHLKTPWVSLFVTEIMLGLSFPLVIIKIKYFFVLPKTFFTFYISFFCMACCYMILGILNRNMFALRDIVYCGYMFFLPLVFTVINNKRSVYQLLLVLFLADLAAIFFGRSFFMESYISPAISKIVLNSKPTNYGLYYGIISSFLISFLFYDLKKEFRFPVLILALVNTYMSFVVGLRCLWLGFLLMFLFVIIVFRNKLLKVLPKFIVGLAVAVSILWFIDGDIFRLSRTSVISAKLESTQEFFFNIPVFKDFFEKYLVKAADDTDPDKILGDIYIAVIKNKNDFKKDIETVNQNLLISSESANKDATTVKKETVVVKKETTVVRNTISKRIKSTEKTKFSTIKKANIEKEIEQVGNIIWRIDIWKQALAFGFSSPVYGKGFGNYPAYKVWGNNVHKYQTVGVDSGIIPTHNHLISIFFKMGFLGLFLFLGFNVYSLIYGISYLNNMPEKFNKYFLAGSLGGLIIWHVMAFFFDIIDSPPTSIFLWIILGFIYSIIFLDKSETKFRGEN